jgi:hypothetical protein
MPIYRSSGAREVWMIECYKYSAPLALSSENLDYNDLLFAQSSNNWSMCIIMLIIINSIRSAPAPEEPDVYSVDGNIFFKLRRSDL